MMNMANNTSVEEKLAFIDENEIIDKVVAGIVWGFLEIPVNAGLFGLVQFDRLSGDPLKRRIIDQVGKTFGIFDIFSTKISFLAILKHVDTFDC